MKVHFTDHGDWVMYTPDPRPLLFKNHPNIIFAKRVSDGVDWYGYQRSTDILTSSSVKVTLMDVNGDLTVMATQRDGSMIWPANQKLIEFELDGDHEFLRRKRFNFATGEFRDAYPDPVLRSDLLIEMHHAGVLDNWERSLKSGTDIPSQISLNSERPMTEEDEYVKGFARKLGWSDEKLKQIFDNARQRIRSKHG